jgi:hypothetical protein
MNDVKSRTALVTDSTSAFVRVANRWWWSAQCRQLIEGRGVGTDARSGLLGGFWTGVEGERD